jgi:mannose/fructose/sorbose-specific phosphotransferase system IIA component
MVSIVLASHGRFSEGIKESGQMIFGPQEDVEAVVLTPEMGPDDFRAKVLAAIDTFSQKEQVLFLVDLWGGTPFNQISKLIEEHDGDGWVAITGMNLPMVIAAYGERMGMDSAAEIAKAQGIRVYTIGVGTEGMAPYPALDMFGQMTFVQQKVEIDEKTLSAIATQTGGRYFRATDKEKLKAIYDEINELEKSKVEISERVIYHELFLSWVLAALALLVAEFLLSTLLLKRIP